jgi:hypothetical protein
MTTVSTSTTPTTARNTPPQAANIVIDFARTSPLNQLAFGMAETGYAAPYVLATDPVEQARVGGLHLGAVRMHLMYTKSGDETSKIVCGGSGCDKDPTGDQWIFAIKKAGAEPVVIVNTTSAVDAANMVRHFNVNSQGVVDPTLPNYIRRWIVGNEPDLNGYSAEAYSAYFNGDYDAMKAVDPSIKIGGPATAWLDEPFIKAFLTASGARVDFVDFHGYPQQGTTNGDVPTLFQWARNTGEGVSKIRAMINAAVPARAANIEVQVGEWSLDWGGNAQMDSNFMSVWTADVIGNILANGGLSIYYGTKGNAIKWSDATVVDDFGRQVVMHLDDPRASYWGHAMFTGAGLFPGFGPAVATASTSLLNVDVFAGTQTIVVVNKNETETKNAVFEVSGRTVSTVEVWQKDQGLTFNAPPAHLGPVRPALGQFTYALPPMSVTTFVVN